MVSATGRPAAIVNDQTACCVLAGVSISGRFVTAFWEEKIIVLRLLEKLLIA